MTARGLAVLLTLASVRSAAAQDAYVYYDHRPGAAGLDARLSYIRPGGDPAHPQIGRPPRLTITPGDRLCVQVRNRNEVLYSYVLTATKVAVDTIAGLGELIKLIGGVFPPQLAVPPSDTDYLTAVARLHDDWQRMQALQLHSDTIVDFTAAAAEMAGLAHAAAAQDSVATQLRNLLSADTTLRVRMLRAVHDDLSKRIKKVGGAFRQALERLTDPICTTVETSRLRVTLRIARIAVDTTATPRRPVGDTVVGVDVDPRDDRTFLLEPGTLLSVFTQDKSTISLQNGVVTQAADHSPGFHAGVFAMARLPSVRWLWATLGAATSEKAVSDLFIGLTLRSGTSLVGGRIGLGLGLALSRVPVGVSQGTVGGALPADVKNVDDIVQRSFRAGLGVTFAVQVP